MKNDGLDDLALHKQTHTSVRMAAAAAAAAAAVVVPETLVRVLLEFLEAAIHMVLYMRAVYPPGWLRRRLARNKKKKKKKKIRKKEKKKKKKTEQQMIGTR